VLKYLLHLGTSYTSGSLDLSYSGISLFPLELVQLTQLRSLILDGNSIPEIPAAASTLVNLNMFSLVNCGCKRIHHKNGSWGRLLNVNVSGNDLRSVPLGWGASSALKTLTLADNGDDLWVYPPPEVVKQRDAACIRYCQGWANGNLAGRLEQEGMSMKSFPLCNLWLQKLRYLSVARNNITVLPEAFDAVSYPALECLLLNNNELPCLPSNFSTLTTLNILNIENNAFPEFPVVIVMFTLLRSLKLAGNLFQHVDARMGRATGLTELSIDHHKSLEPPQEVAELGCRNIVQYWIGIIAARKWGQGSWMPDDYGQLGKDATGGSLLCAGLKLRGFPPEARDFINLSHIDLQRNKISSVPSELLVFRNVHTLDLSYNVIEVVSSVLGNLLFLELLDLSHNKVVELPTLIGNLGFLKVLRVNHNRLADPPHSFGKLVNLTELDISNNKFESIFNGSGNLKKLQIFRCAANKITFLPYEVSETRHTLTTFDFSSNPVDFPGLETQQQPLEILLQYLHRFHSATTSGSLDISGFGLFHVPPSCFTAMTMITELDISRNYIEDLHPDIKALQQLRKLDFHSNNMTSLPLELCLLPSLDAIISYDNELLSPPPEIIERGALHMLEYLKRYMIVRRGSALDLSSLFLSAIPVEVCFISGLISLSLANNGLASLCAGLGQLLQLTELDVSTNKLLALPNTLWKLTNLHRLNLSFNLLPEIASGVSRLLQLRELLFDHNNIPAIQPEYFLPLQHIQTGRLCMTFNFIRMPSDEVQCLPTPAQIRYLQNWATARQTGALDLSDCMLLAFPVDHVADTPSITRLDLSKNRLTSLPHEVSYLTKLLSLNIRDNNIGCLDPCIGGLVALTELLYEGNPSLSFPPQGTLSLGAQKVSLFLRSFLHLPTTGVLELSESLLHVIPPEALMTTQVLALTLTKNFIAELPLDFFHSAQSLQTLVVDFNQLTEVPPILSSLKQLRVFSARGNKITSVHGNICDCSFMRSINLADNDIVDVPWEIGGLQCLEILELKGNARIDMPPLEIITTQGSRGALQYLVRLCQLRINSLCDLSSMDLSEPTLPATVLAQTYLAGLSLSQNKLTTLDDTVALLSNSLVNLFLDDNRMEVIPAVISKLTRLKTLSISGNLLSDVPQWMESMTTLTDVSLANNVGLRYIPYYISLCTNIVRLDLAGLDLLSPPIEVVRVGTDAIMRYVMAVATAFGSLGNFTCNYMELLQIDPQILRNAALVKINMAQNSIKSIDPRIGSLERLTDIDLSFNKIGTLPAEMYNLDRLERLILSHNRLIKVGNWFDDIQAPSRPYTFVITPEQQRELDKRAAQDALAATSSEAAPVVSPTDAAEAAAEGNTVLAPPAALGMFPADHMAAPPKFHYPWPALKHLDLANNEISELSETFGYLTRLESLNLGRNKLSALSVALALLTRLKELELEMNPLSSPPMEIVSRGHEMVLIYLKRFDYIPGLDFTLSLPSLNLSQLPSDLRLYASVLTSLDVSNNCLDTLQENVSVLHRLRELKATSNVISTLPDEIGALLSLQRLHLQVNRLSKLPSAVSLLRSLQLLNVVENSLTALGPEIGGLTALQELRVSRNAIVSIDSSIWKCKSLQIIACESNCLVELPQSVCRLPLLASLLIAKNRIERLPNRLGDLTSLTELDVAENCLEIFPPSLGQIANNIQVLGCKGNPLSFVPPEIGSDRPKVLLGYLKALDEGFATGVLSFVEYGFTVIPPFVYTMTALTELRMSKNRLREVDDDIVVLSSLKLLDVSENFLRSLPLCLHTMPKLTQLITGAPHQNQLDDPPAPVLAQGTPVIMQYGPARSLHALCFGSRIMSATGTYALWTPP
jgi:Leucine-rich repeat (LRR) protein